MNRRIAAIRRGGFAVFACMALALLSTQVQAQSCTGTPQPTIDPVGQTVPKSIPGVPTTVQLKGVTTKVGATFLWEQTLGPVVALSPNGNVANPTFIAPSTGPTVLRFKLTVKCSNGNPGIATTDINVTDVVINAPPTAAASASPASAFEGNVVTLDGTASYDIDPGTTLTYSWQQTGIGPTSPGVTLTSANPAGSIVTFVAPNTPMATGAVLTFRLTVSDGSLTGNIDKTVNIVWTNDPPVATLACPAGGVFIVDEGGAVTLDGSGSSDADGSIVSYSWSQAVGLPNLGVAGLSTPSISFNAPSLGYNQLGSLTLKLTVTDTVGAIDEAVCSVWINDVTAPTIAVPGDQTIEADFAYGKAFIYNVMAFDAVDDQEPYALACTPPSGSDFPLALAPSNQRTTAVACSTVDAAGNVASAGFNVTVQDTSAPVMTLPLSFAIDADGPDGSVAAYEATTWDAVDGVGEANCSPASGSLFAIETIQVTCDAMDARGNAAAAATFELTVHDATAPEIAFHDDVIEEATGPGGAGVSYTLPAVSDVVSTDLVATCSPASGSTFALGSNPVTCNASDGAGNNAVPTSFQVTVQDTTAPVIDAHVSETVEATGPGGAVVSYLLPAVSDAVSTSLVATCSPASGSTFALGPHTVTCNATDAALNAAVATTFQVTVQDTTAPVIDAHVSETVEATGPGGASVSYVLPAVSDAVSTGLVASCLPASGTFALGVHTVTCNAADAALNAAVATTFQVTVQDTTAPVIGAHGNETVEATGPGGASVSYVLPAVSDAVSTSLVASCLPASGTFALGVHTVTCNAADAALNAAVATTFQVTVQDTTAPVIDAHGSETVEATGPGGAVVAYTSPATLDIVDGAGNSSCAPLSGGTFALGETTVYCAAVDHARNAATQTTFKVFVIDTTAPSLTTPGNLDLEATSAAGASVSFATSAVDLVSGTVVVNCSPDSGSTFALGSTTVACHAADAIGNTAHESFNVTVRDTTGPAIAAHADVNANASSNSMAVVTYTLPAASDLVDGPVTVSCTPVSGSTFNVGSTTVTCSATDATGNTSTSTFRVVVSYSFDGFFRPIDNLPTINVVKAGSAIPVKFSLGGNQGLNIFAANHPASVSTACSANQTDAVEETVTAGSSSLQYDSGASQYVYVWKTEKSWTGCRQLQVKLRDGSSRWAMFSFTR